MSFPKLSSWLSQGLLRRGVCTAVVVLAVLASGCGSTNTKSQPSVDTGPGAITASELDDYELFESLGRGGMGEVWRAFDLKLRVDVALKVGSVSASITVVDTSGSTIDEQSGTLGELVSQQLVSDLPLDGGNTVALAGLLPGVVGMNAPTTFTSERGGPTFSVSGVVS